MGLRLIIFADYVCNEACRHCVQNTSRHGHGGRAADAPRRLLRRQRASLADVAAFLTDLAARQPDATIYLSGGEPFLLRRWFDIAAILRDLNLAYRTTTNGTLVEARIDDILAVRPASISFTFNGVGERHDHVVQRPGAYAALMRGLERCGPTLRAAGIRLEGVYVLTEWSHRSIVADLHAIGDVPLQKMTLQHLSYLEPEFAEAHRKTYRSLFGTDSEFIFGEDAGARPSMDLDVLGDQIRAARAETFPFPIDVYPPLIEQERVDDYYSPAPGLYRHRACRRFADELWVLPDGRITSCFSHTFGHVATHTLAGIEQSTERRSWIETLSGLDETLPGCRRCHRIHVATLRAAP